jgi:hypothetical protein
MSKQGLKKNKEKKMKKPTCLMEMDYQIFCKKYGKKEADEIMLRVKALRMEDEMEDLSEKDCIKN